MLVVHQQLRDVERVVYLSLTEISTRADNHRPLLRTSAIFVFLSVHGLLSGKGNHPAVTSPISSRSIVNNAVGVETARLTSVPGMTVRIIMRS